MDGLRVAKTTTIVAGAPPRRGIVPRATWSVASEKTKDRKRQIKKISHRGERGKRGRDREKELGPEGAPTCIINYYDINYSSIVYLEGNYEN